jgi:CobQ/CobB/MinD/ParA family nucleotide binding protein
MNSEEENSRRPGDELSGDLAALDQLQPTGRPRSRHEPFETGPPQLPGQPVDTRLGLNRSPPSDVVTGHERADHDADLASSPVAGTPEYPDLLLQGLSRSWPSNEQSTLAADQDRDEAAESTVADAATSLPQSHSQADQIPPDQRIAASPAAGPEPPSAQNTGLPSWPVPTPGAPLPLPPPPPGSVLPPPWWPPPGPMAWPPVPPVPTPADWQQHREVGAESPPMQSRTPRPPEVRQIQAFRMSTSLDEASIVDPRRSAPRSGWRRAVHRATRGHVNPGASRKDRAEEDLLAEIRQPIANDFRIAVLSIKGGVGKTTTTLGLGSALAMVRRDRVIAVDANPDRGTLAERVRDTSTSSTVRDLLTDPKINSYADIRGHTRMAVSRLEVLASEQDPAAADVFDEADYRRTIAILGRYYNVILTDCGDRRRPQCVSDLGLADAAWSFGSGTRRIRRP